MSYQRADTDSQRQMRMIWSSADQGCNPCSAVCVLDTEVGGGTAYFPPPIDTEGRGGSDSHREGMGELKGRELGTSSRHIQPGAFRCSAPAPCCVSSTPHFTPFLGNIHKSQDSRPSLPEHFPGRVTRSVEEPGADMCLMCLNVAGERGGLRHRIAHCTALPLDGISVNR